MFIPRKELSSSASRIRSLLNTLSGDVVPAGAPVELEALGTAQVRRLAVTTLEVPVAVVGWVLVAIPGAVTNSLHT